jgi:hypothetical protein
LRFHKCRKNGRAVSLNLGRRANRKREQTCALEIRRAFG